MSVLFGKLKKYHKEIEMDLIIEEDKPLELDNIGFYISYDIKLVFCVDQINTMSSFFSVMEDIIKIKHNLYEFDGWYCGRYCNEVWD